MEISDSGASVQTIIGIHFVIVAVCDIFVNDEPAQTHVVIDHSISFFIRFSCRAVYACLFKEGIEIIKCDV